MRTYLLTLLALALTSPVARPLCAQYGPIGARVRVTSPVVPGEQVIGRLAAFTPDSLAVTVGRGSGTLRLDARHVEQLELSGGHARTQGAMIGATIGLLGSTALGALSGGPMGGITGFLVGVVVVAPLGAGIGAFTAPERWAPYPLPRQKW